VFLVNGKERIWYRRRILESFKSLCVLFSFMSEAEEHTEVEPHVGSSVVGLVIFVLMLFALYSQMWIYSMYSASLLVILALGNKFLDKQ
jgi:hypothetical protein